MDKLLKYINSLPEVERLAFAARCGASIKYLRKACSVKQNLSEGLCLRIVFESANAMSLEDLRPDVDWSYMRLAISNVNSHECNVTQGYAAIKNIAHAA